MDCNTTHFNKINSTLQKFKPILFNIINKHAAGLIFDLQHRIETSRTFNLANTNALSIDHPCYLLIHHACRSYDLILQLHRQKKARDTAFKEFIIPFMQELNSVIWTGRASNFKQWDTTQGITEKKKKRYHQFFKHDHKEISRINNNHPLSIPYDRSDGRLGLNAHIDGRLVIFYIQAIENPIGIISR